MPGNKRSCGPAYRKASGSYSPARRAGLVAGVSPVQDLAAAAEDVATRGAAWLPVGLAG